MINLQLSLPHHIDSVETLIKNINERLQEPDSQGLVSVTQVLWDGMKEEWFYIKNFQVRVNFFPSQHVIQELTEAIKISPWWFIE